ncbi:MAG: M24 family metallopeptidase [Chloroflexota bacterium]
MKTDIDALMKENKIDVLFITGAASNNPFMYYFTGNVHVGAGEIIKKLGEEPILFYNPMEREEAAKSGMKTKNRAEFKFADILKSVDGDAQKATAGLYEKMLGTAGVTGGRMGIYGKVEIGRIYEVLGHLNKNMPELEIVGEGGVSVLSEAMVTKDETEVDRIRQMGKVTEEVVGKTAKFLQSHKAKDGVLVKDDGTPLKIKDVKAKINYWVMEAGVTNPHDCIFALGRDAGIPHSVGTLDDNLVLGKTIVFDIFLQEAGAGYHYDFTRTWCLGFAPEAEQKMYDDVRTVFDDVMGGLEANASLVDLQTYTCELFEAQGHPTIRQDATSQEGYVHSLGHGLGLNIHELPFSRGSNNSLQPGVVATIEPGLYYPDKDMGCRIEDSIYVHPDGQIEILADYPYDLVLPIEEL